jgi:hypothetical protein
MQIIENEEDEKKRMAKSLGNIMQNNSRFDRDRKGQFNSAAKYIENDDLRISKPGFQ